MKQKEKLTFPSWMFAVLAIGGFLASGIFIGIMSIEEFTAMRFSQAAGFGIMGLVMFWGAIKRD